jgi:hypothetical protein
MDPLGVLLSFLGLLYFLYLSYSVWIRPKQYMKDIHKRRVKLKSQFSFIPDWLIGYIFLFEIPQLSIWWARIVYLIAVLLCIIGLIGAVHGPF